MQLVTCEKHGQGPGYCICLHVANGAKAVHIDKATENELGCAVCAECDDRSRSLTADDFLLYCAGCFAELTTGKEL
jgi:hypothetical protein